MFIMLTLMINTSTSALQSSALPYYLDRSLIPQWVEDRQRAEDNDDRELHAIADFTLVNQNGEIIRQQALNAKIVVANFFFASCGGICPTNMRNLRTVQQATDERVLILSHSITPEIDTPAALADYAKRHRINNDRWHLLTGSSDSILDLARNAYFAEFDDAEAQANSFIHTEKVFLVDPNKHIRGVYNGTSASDMQRLLEDIDVLLEETL